MAALEGQRLVAELFPDSGSEPDFEGFHVSEQAGNLSGGDDSGSEAVTESDDDEGVTGRLSDAAAAPAYRTNPNLPGFIHPHSPLTSMHQAPLHMRGAFFARSSLMSCLPCWWRKPTGTMTRLLLH